MIGAGSVVAALAGLGLSLSLIVAIGAQNAYVLRQGLRREHVVPIVAVCAISDATLILAGVAGGGAVLDRWPWLLVVVRVGGAAFLLLYALLSARRALRPAVLSVEVDGERSPLATVLLTTLALTWLNPHVYLDTVVLLGSIAHSYEGDQWWFAAGATLASVLWFCALGFGARLLRPLFARPIAWRVLDASIAVVMATLALLLLVRP